MELGMKSPSSPPMDPSLSPVTPFTETPSGDLEVSISRSLPHHKRQYTPSEWQSKKAIIQELYLDRGLPLKKVMEALRKEPHHFHPTPRMYKQRLESWGYFKNCTERRVRTILHDKTERGAVEKVVKFGRNGEDRSAQKITKYLSRKKITLSELVTTDNNRQVRAHAMPVTLSQGGTLNNLNTGLNLANSQSTGKVYEDNCPYRPWAKVFRLIEKFPSGATYQGDSFGYHSYIDVEEGRDCSPQCLCHHHDVSKTFTFIVYKSPKRLDITILSDGLHSELITLLEPLESPGFRLQNPFQQNSIDGLVLLKHYHTLHKRLEIIHSVSPASQIWRDTERILEMELLVEGLLADDEVFKSMGYETLYERGFLDYEIWKKFQQQKIERDIQALDDAFCAIDDLDSLGPPPDSRSLHVASPFSQFAVSAVEDVFGADNEIEKMSQSRTTNILGLDMDETPPIFEEDNQHTKSRHEIPTDQVMEDVNSRPNDLESFHQHRANLLGSEPLAEFEPKSKPLNAQLIEAAMRGYKSVVGLLLDRGANMNLTSTFGGTPLVEAAKQGRKEVVQLLLDRGADMNLTSTYGGTPLVEAAKQGHKEVVQLLLDRGADVNLTPKYGDTPLVGAAKQGRKEVVQLLLDRGADVNLTSTYGDTPLVEAAKQGRKEVVQLLLDRGADVNLTPKYGDTPLVGAAKQGRKEVVQLLLDRGADVNLTSTYGDTPLVEAAKQGRKEVVQLLLDRGADVNLTPKYGDTPLVGAAKQGRKEVVQLLLDRGANMNLTSTFGDTPLVEAAKQGHKGVVQLLLDRGADVNLAFGCKNTPLVEATKQGHKGVVRLLLDRGAGIDRFSYFHLRRTALAEAADKGDESMVQLLLNRGANKNTGLFSSAWAGDVVGTWTLLRLGADKNFALVGAAMSGRKPAVLELLKDGADPNVITPHGTALSAAASARWHEHVINLLLQEGADVQTAVCLLQGDGHTASARRLLRSISRPRDSVATVLELQNLRLHFVHQYTLMINVGQGSSTKCRSLAQSFRNYRDAWAAGTSAMRGLCLGGRPETFHDTMSFLCLARAIVETLGNSGHGDYLEHFLLDLNRWQELFRSNAEEFDAYREAVYSMWGVLLDQTEVVYEDALISFQQLASTLIHHAKESLDLDVFGNEGLEPSQRRWLERTSQILSTNDQAANAEGERSYGVDNTQQLEPGPLWDLDPPPPTIIVPLKERIKNDASSPVVEPMVILLMAGAVFAIVIVFLQVLRNISAGFISGSFQVGGISSLQERCRVLEDYLDLKGAVVSSFGSVAPGDGDFEPFLY